MPVEYVNGTGGWARARLIERRTGKEALLTGPVAKGARTRVLVLPRTDYDVEWVLIGTRALDSR